MGRNKSIIIKILLLILIIFVCLFIFEIIFRYLGFACSVIDENGEGPFIISGDNFYMKPNYMGRDECIWYSVEVKTNNEGFRDSEFDDYGQMIFMFGDYVFGTGVNQDETFAEVLEKVFLKNTKVYNFGTGGYSPKEYIKQYDKYANKFNPKLVIIALYEGNDVQEDCGLINRADFYGGTRKGIGKIKDILKKVYIIRVIDQLCDKFINYGETDTTSKPFYLRDEPEFVKKCNDILKDNMRILKGNASADNRGIMFVILPSKATFMKSDNPAVDYGKKIKDILNICSELNLTCLNIKDYINDSKDFYSEEGHFSVKGHYDVAKAIYYNLNDNIKKAIV